MRTALAFVLVLALPACSGVVVGPDPIPGQGFRAVAHVSGDFDAQAFAYATPLTSLVRAHGNMTVTVRTFPPPHLTLDGGADLIVEPAPGLEQEAQAAVLRGEILIRRRGAAGPLNAPGSIQRFKVELQRIWAPAPQKATPLPPPPPLPKAPAEPTACVGPDCAIPNHP